MEYIPGVRLSPTKRTCAADDRNETLGRKIRDNQLQRVPYMLIVGEKEETAMRRAS